MNEHQTRIQDISAEVLLCLESACGKDPEMMVEVIVALASLVCKSVYGEDGLHDILDILQNDGC